MKDLTYMYIDYLRGLAVFASLVAFIGMSSSMSVAQTQSNNSQSEHIAVKTKMDIAIEREQKKELKRAKALEIQNEQTGGETVVVKMQQKQLVSKTYDAGVILEKQVQVKSYELGVKEENMSLGQQPSEEGHIKEETKTGVVNLKKADK